MASSMGWCALTNWKGEADIAAHTLEEAESSRGLVQGSGAAGRPRIAANGQRAFHRFDPIAAAKASDEGMCKGGLRKIKRQSVIDDAGHSGGRHRPSFRAASLVEPGADDLKLPPKALRRHCNPDADRKPSFHLASRLRRSSGHFDLPFAFCSGKATR